MKAIKVLLLFILLAMLGFSLYKINEIKKELTASEEIKEELIELVEIPEVPSEESSFEVDFNELKKINSDVIGWIVIEGTQVNYPVVQGNNNSYYLNHSYLQLLLFLILLLLFDSFDIPQSIHQLSLN